jgi:hypothetical protein
MRVVAKPIRWSRRADVAEYARRLQGLVPDPTIDCTAAVERRVGKALHAGADVYHQRSGRTTYAFRTRVPPTTTWPNATGLLVRFDPLHLA